MRTNRIAHAIACTAAGVALLTAPVAGQETSRVSVDSSGGEANGNSFDPALSADGRIVTFWSYASNLVGGDANGWVDVFASDRSSGTTERVSVDSSGAEGNGHSFNPTISADGRFVAFVSFASNLVAGDTNGSMDVFVHDRVTGATERVSVASSGAQGNEVSFSPAISADGQVVSFVSLASNLAAADTNGATDVYVHDRASGLTQLVSVDSSGVVGNSGSYYPAISADGSIVAYHSFASNLVPGDLNGTWDVFVFDRATALTELVSADASGAAGDADSYFPSITADGRQVAFASDASNLVAGDTNATDDVFVRDRATGVTELISVDSSGLQGNDESSGTSITADGKIVGFWSEASNLVSADANGTWDVFVHDRSSGATERISVDPAGGDGDGKSTGAAISSDGGIVAFSSYASNLVTGDANGASDAFVRERCLTAANWTNYGAGFPGSSGVPSFTARNDPQLGASITLDLANSRGAPTAGLLFVGFQRTQLRSSWGGDLLVVPAVTLPVDLPATGASFTGSLPNDHALCGLALDLQAIENDPGAVRGVSFTAGLELLLGD